MISKKEGLILYACEGFKTGQSVGVANTSASLLNMFLEWMELYYNRPRSSSKLLVHLWDIYRPKEEEIKAQWCKLLNVNISQFTKTLWKPTISSNRKYPLGVCRVRFHSKDIHEQIMKEWANLEEEYYHID